MSPTLLEATIAVVAAVLVFLFAIRAVPFLIDYLSHYFERSSGVEDAEEKETHEYER